MVIKSFILFDHPLWERGEINYKYISIYWFYKKDAKFELFPIVLGICPILVQLFRKDPLVSVYVKI